MKVKPIGPTRHGKQQYFFLCPGCAQYDDPGYTLHSKHVFDSTWTYNGDGEKPTVDPSILLSGGGEPAYRCHSFIREGRIQFLADCSHALAGQTVELPEISP